MKRLAIGLVLAMGLLACEREPAIVVRFEPADLSGRHDLARAVDAAAPRDLAPAADPKETCGSDADCVATQVDCCDCAHGGRRHAVLKRGVRAFSENQLLACKDQMCTAMMSVDPSCGQRAACVDAHCVLRAAKPDAAKKKPSPAAQ